MELNHTCIRMSSESLGVCGIMTSGGRRCRSVHNLSDGCVVSSAEPYQSTAQQPGDKDRDGTRRSIENHNSLGHKWPSGLAVSNTKQSPNVLGQYQASSAALG